MPLERDLTSRGVLCWFSFRINTHTHTRAHTGTSCMASSYTRLCVLSARSRENPCKGDCRTVGANTDLLSARVGTPVQPDAVICDAHRSAFIIRHPCVECRVAVIGPRIVPNQLHMYPGSTRHHNLCKIHANANRKDTKRMLESGGSNSVQAQTHTHTLKQVLTHTHTHATRAHTHRQIDRSCYMFGLHVTHSHTHTMLTFIYISLKILIITELKYI